MSMKTKYVQYNTWGKHEGECGWNKQNKYGNQIDISLVTFPFQRNLRQPFLSPKTFFTTETNYKDLQSRDKKNLQSTRAQGHYKNNTKTISSSLLVAYSRSLSLFFNSVFLIVSLRICLCQCGILCEKMHHPHRFY